MLRGNPELSCRYFLGMAVTDTVARASVSARQSCEAAQEAEYAAVKARAAADGAQQMAEAAKHQARLIRSESAAKFGK